MTLRGIPLTTPTRTILDPAPAASPDDLEQLLAEAYARRLTSRDKLLTLVARHPSRPGTPRLRHLLDAASPPAFTRAKSERLILALIRKAELQSPRVNTRAHGHEVDFLWADRKLVIEVDGYATHTSPGRFERDRCRDAELVLRGYRVIRVTWRQLTGHPEAVIARLAAALADSAAEKPSA